MYKWLGAVFAVVICIACGNPLAGTNNGFMPVDGDYPGLIADGKRKTYILDKDRQKYLGNNAAIFENYGLSDFFHNEYTLGGSTNYLSIESYKLSGDNGAAGVFYYFVRRKLKTKGEQVDIGADGVIDVVHDGRNVYFFKGRWFFAIVYSGKGETPDLVSLGRYIASQVSGQNTKPNGFRYLEVDGISAKYAYVSAGNALNMEFLPPSVTTFVSSVGLEANVFISNYFEEKEAVDAEDSFRMFMRGNCTDYSKSMINVDGKKYPVYQAFDEQEGIMLFSRYKKTVVTFARVTEIEKSKVLLERIIRKIKLTPASNTLLD